MHARTDGHRYLDKVLIVRVSTIYTGMYGTVYVISCEVSKRVEQGPLKLAHKRSFDSIIILVGTHLCFHFVCVSLILCELIL